MSYASPAKSNSINTSAVDEVSRVGATSWKTVVEAAETLNKDCVDEQDVGGAAIVESG